MKINLGTKIIISTITSVLLVFGIYSIPKTVNVGASVLFPQQGGTGTSSKPTLGQILIGNASGTYSLSATSTLGIIHSTLTGLSADDHTQYALLAGRSGGQTLIGGTASGGNLTLQSTSHATKGKVILGSTSGVVFDEVNNRLGIGTVAPGNLLHLSQNTGIDGANPITLKIESNTVSTGAWTQGGTMGQILFDSLDVSGGAGTRSAIKSIVEDTGGADSGLGFFTTTNGATGITEQIRISNAGNVGIGTTAPAQKLDITGGSVRLDDTTTSTSGVVYKGATAFMHNFHHPTGSTAVPAGYNTFVGELAGNFTMGSTATSVWHGSYNTAMGRSALQNNTTGFRNTASGYASLYNNTTGYNNMASGLQSLNANTTGYQNTASGMNALLANTTGYNNTADGYNAGRYIADGATANATGNNSLFLGYDTRALADGGTNQVVIGAGAIGNGSNSVVLGNDSITTTALKGNVGVGTSTPQRKISASSGASATTTVQFGDIYSGTGKGCVEMPNTTGTVTSFYFVGTTMVIEPNACR